VISCSSFTDSSSRSSNATMRRRVGSDRARNDFKVADMLSICLSVFHMFGVPPSGGIVR